MMNSTGTSVPGRDTSEWRRSRQMAIDRDGGECRNCNRDYDLQVHHVLPEEKGGTHAQNNLLTLCNDCHWYLHRNSSKWDGDELGLEKLDGYEPPDYSGWRVNREFKPVEREILRLLKTGGEFKRKTIGEEVDASLGHINSCLKRLRISGYVMRERRGIYRFISPEESKKAREETS